MAARIAAIMIVEFVLIFYELPIAAGADVNHDAAILVEYLSSFVPSFVTRKVLENAACGCLKSDSGKDLDAELQEAVVYLVSEPVTLHGLFFLSSPH